MGDTRLKKLTRLMGGEYDFHYDRMVFPLFSVDRRKASNMALLLLESLLRAGRPLSYPLCLQLEPTTHCQLSCGFCPRERVMGGSPPMHMEWGSYESLMREIGPYLLSIAFWQWGEPLLHPRIIDMVGLAKKYGIFSMISTNGQIDTGKFSIRDLMKAGLDLLIISMDGATQGSYSVCRSGGHVDVVRRFVEESVRAKRGLGAGPLINIRIVATRDNEAEVEDVREFARLSGADVFSVKSVSLYYDDDPGHPLLPANSAYRSFQYQGAEEARRYREEIYRCAKPWWWPTLRCDGRLLACECDHAAGHALGNVFAEGSFRRVWRGHGAQEMRRRFSGGSGIDLDFCRRCRYKRNDAIREVEYFRR